MTAFLVSIQAFIVSFVVVYGQDDPLAALLSGKKAVYIPAWARSPYDADVTLPGGNVQLDGAPALPRHSAQVQSLLAGDQPFAFDPRRPTLLRHAEGGPLPLVTDQPGTGNGPPLCPKPDFSACITQKQINDRISRCCINDVLIPVGCRSLCRLEITPTVQSGQCTYDQLQRVLACHSANSDASPCCEAKRVFADGREICRPFCNPSASPLPPPTVDLLKCVSQYDIIRSCFTAYHNF